VIDFEFYETPRTFTRWLFRAMAHRGLPIVGTVLEPCVGNGAILRAAELRPREFGVVNHWRTNDLDPRWATFDDARGRWTFGEPGLSLYHSVDDAAASTAIWTEEPIDWTVSNPPFSPAIEITTHALKYSRVGVAMHLRASIHEVLKTGVRRTWMAQHTPTGILWLPRFAYQRSKTTGKWTTDSVCACWVIWLKDPNVPQFIDYAPEWVIDALDAETPAYRARMDALMAERAA
jgi:hypothetical protein